MIIWLPLSGSCFCSVGLMIAPITVRLKGLNLGLSNISFSIYWFPSFFKLKTVTGGAGLGRKAAKLKLFGVDFENGFKLEHIF